MGIQDSSLYKHKVELSLLRAALVLIVSLLLFIAMPAAGAQTAPFESINPNTPEVQSLIKDKKVTITEAKKRVFRQMRAMQLSDSLPASVGAASFGGTWIDSNDRVKVGIKSSDSGKTIKKKEKIKSESTKLQINDAVDVQIVSHSFQELEELRTELANQLKRVTQTPGWSIAVGIVPSKNAVLIQVPRDTKHLTTGQSAFIKNAKQKYGTAVTVSTYNYPITVNACAKLRYCDDPLRGGIGLTSNSKYSKYKNHECSAGFIVQGNSGQRYILTAGHCGVVSGAHGWGSKSAHSTLKKIGPTHRNVLAEGKQIDGMLIRIRPEYGRKSRGWVFIRAGEGQGGYHGPKRNETYAITGRRNSSGLEGQRVCQSGASTGSSCGPVEAVNIERDIQHPDGSIWHYKSLVMANLCSALGDSGGSVTFQGNALGVLTGNPRDGPLCGSGRLYTGINAIRSAMGNSFEIVTR